jgi:hypothetical protein
MSENDYLGFQVNVICLLLALIGATVIAKHPDWFGALPGGAVHSSTSVSPRTN